MLWKILIMIFVPTGILFGEVPDKYFSTEKECQQELKKSKGIIEEALGDNLATSCVKKYVGDPA